jgi:Na+-transporting NADH:ubiquinone oxidoreductase subunit C
VSRLESPRYVVAFATAVCVVCALIVSLAAVGLSDRQAENARLYRHKNVLLAAGLVQPEDRLSDAELMRRFDAAIRPALIDLATGTPAKDTGLDPRTYDPRRARNDPQMSRAAPPNDAGIARLPKFGVVYFVQKDDASPQQVVLPVEGVGMWGLMAGFIALDRDGTTVRGLTFHEQKETPGLGGEISNPRWQALWVGRKAFDAAWTPQLRVIKGKAGAPEKDPHRIDGLSGATITSQAVSRLIGFWLSEAGYKPFLERFRKEAAA